MFAIAQGGLVWFVTRSRSAGNPICQRALSNHRSDSQNKKELCTRQERALGTVEIFVEHLIICMESGLSPQTNRNPIHIEVKVTTTNKSITCKTLAAVRSDHHPAEMLRCERYYSQ